VQEFQTPSDCLSDEEECRWKGKSPSTDSDCETRCTDRVSTYASSGLHSDVPIADARRLTKPLLSWTGRTGMARKLVKRNKVLEIF